jgi:glycerol-3-phosphate acyltransferase PlsY
MQLWLPILVILGSYILGSLPTGVIIVKLSTGKDVRGVGSGRIGGTNAMRAAGFWAGLGTAILDILKSTVTVWLALFLFPDNPWLHILAPLAAVIGHNYSIFLVRMDHNGRLDLGGGAGGAPTVGGALGLWPPSILFIIPLGALIFYFIGYASVTTMSVALITTLIFAYRTWMGVSPWQYILYSVVAEILLLWSLRPNIQRLVDGTERVVGYRARKKEKVSDKSDAT